MTQDNEKKKIGWPFKTIHTWLIVLICGFITTGLTSKVFWMIVALPVPLRYISDELVNKKSLKKSGPVARKLII